MTGPKKNTDLLPPLFDEILKHYGPKGIGSNVRAELITALENSLIDAVADAERAAASVPGYTRSDAETLNVTTFDRLSGDGLSRAALTEELQTALSFGNVVVDAVVIETALLLIEAQIDLRLTAGRKFKIAEIEFELALEGQDKPRDIAAWCRNVLSPILQSATGDVPTVWNRWFKHRPEGLRVLVEGLQLSATLREAAPYTIRVDAGLVRERLASPRQDARIRLLHISDLHMVEDLTDPQRGGSPTLGQAKHNVETAKLLSSAVDSLRPEHDLLVATGDLTTDGARGSFEAVLQYVQSGPIAGENKMRIAFFGLDAGRAQRVLLPGNHDRFDARLVPRQKLSDMFERVLGTHPGYPYVRGFRPPKAPAGGLTLLLFVFDSNLPVGNQKETWLNSLARGRIGSGEVEQFIKLATDAKENSKVLDLNGQPMTFDPANTIRIALLHHHPVAKLPSEEELRRRAESSWRRWREDPVAAFKDAWKDAWRPLEESSMLLEHADEFLAGCFRAGIQLILFGHQHYEYRRPVVVRGDAEVASLFGGVRSLRAFCCPTTLERSPHGNGFYVFDFVDKDTFSVDYYSSASGEMEAPMPFRRIAKRSGVFKVSELSLLEVESAYAIAPPVAPEEPAPTT